MTFKNNSSLICHLFRQQKYDYILFYIYNNVKSSQITVLEIIFKIIFYVVLCDIAHVHSTKEAFRHII